MPMLTWEDSPNKSLSEKHNVKNGLHCSSLKKVFYEDVYRVLYMLAHACCFPTGKK